MRELNACHCEEKEAFFFAGGKREGIQVWKAGAELVKAIA
jgi:hypothetical protein